MYILFNIPLLLLKCGKLTIYCWMLLITDLCVLNLQLFSFNKTIRTFEVYTNFHYPKAANFNNCNQNLTLVISYFSCILTGT